MGRLAVDPAVTAQEELATVAAASEPFARAAAARVVAVGNASSVGAGLLH